MNISVREGSEAVAVVVTGRFDVHEVPSFRAAVEPLATSGVGDLAIDLSETVFIDSAGLAELIRAMRRCRERGADLVLDRPSQPVLIILELTRLDQAFTIGAGI